MSKVTIWQCEDDCCDRKPYSGRYWMARSSDWRFYEEAPTFYTAITLAANYLKDIK